MLTEPLEAAIRAWAEVDGVDVRPLHRGDARVARRRSRASWPRDNPVAALERGEIEVPHFEEQLAARLTAATGHPIEPVGLLQRMFDQFEHAPAMSALVLRAKRAGLRTGLLSNSWGNEYPREGWDEMFDAVVISGEVGMRKPEPEIFAHVLELLGVRAEETVFVDDLQPNVERRRGARAWSRAPHVVRTRRRTSWSGCSVSRCAVDGHRLVSVLAGRGSAGPLPPGSRPRRRRCRAFARCSVAQRVVAEHVRRRGRDAEGDRADHVQGRDRPAEVARAPRAATAAARRRRPARWRPGRRSSRARPASRPGGLPGRRSATSAAPRRC